MAQKDTEKKQENSGNSVNSDSNKRDVYCKNRKPNAKSTGEVR